MSLEKSEPTAFPEEQTELPHGIARRLKSRVEHLREKHRQERRAKHVELRDEGKEFAEHEQDRTLFEHLEGSNTYEQKKAREEDEANEPYNYPPQIETPNRCMSFFTQKFGLRHGVVLHGIGHTSRNSTREKIARFIHGKHFQVVVVIMLLLDVCFVIAELILQSYQTCEFYLERDRCEEPPAGAFPLIEEEFENANGFFAPTGCGAFADATMPHSIHTAEKVLVWLSRAILIFFTVEILTTLACLGKRFFTFLYLLDFVVVVTSLILSFVFDSNAEAEAESAVIIFLRCWRFARVLHGFGVTVHTAEVQHEHTLKERAKMEEEKDGEKSEDEKLEEGQGDDEAPCSSPMMERQYLDQVTNLRPHHKEGIQDLLDQKSIHLKELEDLCHQLQEENDKLKAELEGPQNK